MQTYKVKVKEQISVWQDKYFTVKADNALELKQKIMMWQDIEAVEAGEIHTETIDNLKWDLKDMQIVQIGDLKL